MNYVQNIEDFFDYVLSYLNILIDFLNIEDLKNLLIYLFNCIPVPIQACIFLLILFFIVAGCVKAFRE